MARILYCGLVVSKLGSRYIRGLELLVLARATRVDFNSRHGSRTDHLVFTPSLARAYRVGSCS
jgi:hypothetical protein